VPEQGENREHPAVVVLALGQAQLLEDGLDVTLDGARAEERARPRPRARGLADRVEALGGRLSVESPRGGGTVLRAAIPRG
jgi:hypothetical protein